MLPIAEELWIQGRRRGGRQQRCCRLNIAGAGDTAGADKHLDLSVWLFGLSSLNTFGTGRHLVLGEHLDHVAVLD